MLRTYLFSLLICMLVCSQDSLDADDNIGDTLSGKAVLFYGASQEIVVNDNMSWYEDYIPDSLRNAFEYQTLDPLAAIEVDGMNEATFQKLTDLIRQDWKVIPMSERKTLAFPPEIEWGQILQTNGKPTPYTVDFFQEMDIGVAPSLRYRNYTKRLLIFAILKLREENEQLKNELSRIRAAKD